MPQMPSPGCAPAGGSPLIFKWQEILVDMDNRNFITNTQVLRNGQQKSSSCKLSR